MSAVATVSSKTQQHAPKELSLQKNSSVSEPNGKSFKSSKQSEKYSIPNEQPVGSDRNFKKSSNSGREEGSYIVVDKPNIKSLLNNL